MLNTTFAPWPSFTEEEADAVAQVMRSNRVNYWTGTECRNFETEFASWCGARFAVAVTNGTLALELALHALGVGPGDEVIVTPRSFIASVSCVVNAGAVPVFADVDVRSGNLTAETIERVITPRTAAVICVHLAGWPCDMDPILALASRRGFKVIEDCAQAHGARYRGRSVGSIGDIGAWSFCQDKIMSTGGEGGMVTTNDESLWRAMWSFKDHGKSYAAVYEREHAKGFRWVHESFGTNWRMLEVQAVIGRIQLRRMTDWTIRRTANAEAIRAACLPHPIMRMPDFACREECSKLSCGKLSDCVHAYYKCYGYIRQQHMAAGWTRDKIIAAIEGQGVPCYQGTCSEVYREKAFDQTGWRPAERLPVAKELGETSLMFLVHPTLTEQQLALTCSVIGSVLRAAS